MTAPPAMAAILLILALSTCTPARASTRGHKPCLDRYGDPLPEGAVRRLGSLRFRHGGVGDLAFTPDGKYLIAGGYGSSLAVFDAASGRKLHELGTKGLPFGDLLGFAVSPDGKRIAGCGSDVFLWDLETGRLIRQFYYNGRYKSVAFSSDGSKIAAIKEERRGDELQFGIVVGEAATGKHAAEWTVKEGKPLAFGFHGLAFSSDGKFLAGKFYELREERPFIRGIASAQVWLLDAATGARARTFGLADVPTVTFAFQPGTGRLTTYGKDGMIRFWDVQAGKEVQRFQAAKGKEPNGFTELRFSADGRRCAVLTDRAKFLTVLDTRDGRVLRRMEGEERGLRTSLALSADGKTVAARHYTEPCVRLWDVASGVERSPNPGHRAPIARLSLSGDGRTLISRDEEGAQVDWDLRSGKGEVRPNATQKDLGRLAWMSLDFSQGALRGPRWRLVYKHQRPAMLEVWSLDGSRLIRKAEAQGRYVPYMALSPDGALLALAAYNDNDANSTVMLWDPVQEDKPRRMDALSGPCSQIQFSHGGKKLIGAGGRGLPPFTGSLWIWDVAKGRVLREQETKNAPGHLLLTADDRVLLVGCAGPDTSIHAREMESGRELARLAVPLPESAGKENDPRLQPALTGLALSADERFLAAVSSRGDASMISIWETGSWKQVRTFAPLQPRNDVKAMIFSRDDRSLYIANNDSTILEWDVSGRYGKDTEAPSSQRLPVLWRTLAEPPDRAYPAVWELLDHAAESVPFLVGKLSPVEPVEEKRVRQLLARLDSESFAEREEASRQLVELGEQALPVLRQAVKEGMSPEAKRRAERAIASLTHGPSREQLRLLRALAVLEWSGAADSVKHIRLLADGAPSASLTCAAREAWQRRKR